MTAAHCWTCSEPIKEAGDGILCWWDEAKPGVLVLLHRGQCFATHDAWNRPTYTVELQHHPGLFETLAGFNTAP